MRKNKVPRQTKTCKSNRSGTEKYVSHSRKTQGKGSSFDNRCESHGNALPINEKIRLDDASCHIPFVGVNLLFLKVIVQFRQCCPKHRIESGEHLARVMLFGVVF